MMKILHKSSTRIGTLVKTGEVVNLTQFRTLPKVASILHQCWQEEAGISLVQFDCGSKSSNPWKFATPEGEVVEIVYTPEEKRKLEQARAAYNSFRGKPSYY